MFGKSKRIGKFLKAAAGLLLLMVFTLTDLAGLYPTTVYADQEVTLSVVPSKTTAHPGDTIRYTVKLGAVSNLGCGQFKLSIPEGLSFVSASVPDDLKTTLNIGSNALEPSFTESSKIMLIFGADYSGDSEIVLLTFTCTVGEDALGDKTVSLSDVVLADNTEAMNDFSTTVSTTPVTIQPAPIDPTGISLDRGSVTLTKGRTQQLTAEIAPMGATGTVTWSSSSSDVASVENGLITAKDIGTTTITARIAGTEYVDICQVEVVACLHEHKTHHDASSATCTDDAYSAYDHCNDCGEDIGKTMTAPSLGHSYYGAYDKDDIEHWRACTRGCGTVERGNHTFGTTSYTWATDHSTCTASHSCTVCGREVSETVDSNSQLFDATCTEGEKTEFVATFTKPGFDTQRKSVYEGGGPLGHSWGQITYVWSDDGTKCTASRTCTRAASHVETETVDATTEITKMATCTEKGKARYIVTFENAGFETQRSEEFETAIKPHTYGNEGSSRYTCTECGTVDDTLKAQAEAADKKAAEEAAKKAAEEAAKKAAEEAARKAAEEAAKTAVGAVAEQGGAEYKVTAAGQVAYTSTDGRKKTTYTVPDTMKIGDKTMKVTEVDANAFKGCDKMKKVVIGKNVARIAAKTFKGKKKLKKVTIKSKNLTSVGTGAFKNLAPGAKIYMPKLTKAQKAKYKKLFKKKVIGSAKIVWKK